MATANPAQLFLLADHIKLSLLERQRAISLNLSPNAQDAQITRSLGALDSGVAALAAEIDTGSDDADPAALQQLEQLRTEHADLSLQLRTQQRAAPAATPPPLAAPAPRRPAGGVRFADDPARAELFPYRDDPDDEDAREAAEAAGLDNQGIHEYHRTVLARQDDQLGELGQSIGRQRELTIAIGDELDEHVLMLDEVDGAVDRHQTRLDSATRRLGNVVKKAKENWSITTIFSLILILILLIVVTKK
jgi:syntaxin 8